jgi:prepilin-type N-terminal cleavage/methylation domain-containing protein
MKRLSPFNKKGITLIELLVALVISAITIAGIYRLFISQGKAYTVQDQVVEVQQNIRMAMEVLSRDLRMTGFDDDKTDNSTYPDGTANPKIVTVPTAIVTPVQDSDITINYEYFDRNVNPGQRRHTVRFWRDGATWELKRTLAVDGGAPGPVEIILENVNALIFTYGVDANNDGIMDDQNGNGLIDDNDWLTGAGVGTAKVIAVRAMLTARSDQTNPDAAKMVSPRTLVSAVTLRNLCLR